MTKLSIFALLLSAYSLPLHASEAEDDLLFQVNRCVLAYAHDTRSDMAVVDKATVAVQMYMRERGIKKTFAEISAIYDRGLKEILGPPDSSIEERATRAREITESDLCKEFLSSLQAK